MRSSQSTKSLSSREKIVRAATALFAAKGFGGTSTREVARKARVNEITVYRLFKNKQELYLQVLDRKMEVKEPDWLRCVLQLSDDPKLAFLSLAERLEELLDPVFFRLLFYAALEKPELLRKRYRSGLVSFHEVLGRHIRERIDSQILRDIDPGLLGRALVGVIAYQRICGLWGDPGFLGCNAAGVADVYTDTWHRGALASEAPAHPDNTERPSAQAEVAFPDRGNSQI
jgi:AcrR family transcriptional regulator